MLILLSEHSFSFLVSFLVDARGGAMRGCRHSGIRIIVPPRSAAQPTRITCRYVKPQRTLHPPQLMESEALASRVLELGPVAAKFIGPVIMEVPHFASLRGKEREIVILRSDNGETWREHQVENSDEIIHDILNEYFEPEGMVLLTCDCCAKFWFAYNGNFGFCIQILIKWMRHRAEEFAASLHTISHNISLSCHAFAKRCMPSDQKVVWSQAPLYPKCKLYSHKAHSPKKSKLAYR